MALFLKNYFEKILVICNKLKSEQTKYSTILVLSKQQFYLEVVATIYIPELYGIYIL